MITQLCITVGKAVFCPYENPFKDSEPVWCQSHCSHRAMGHRSRSEWQNMAIVNYTTFVSLIGDEILCCLQNSLREWDEMLLRAETNISVI
jgi:hypothetical protein